MEIRVTALLTIILSLAFVGSGGTAASAGPCSCWGIEKKDLGNGRFRCPVKYQDLTGVPLLDIGENLGVKYATCTNARVAKKSKMECKIAIKTTGKVPPGC